MSLYKHLEHPHVAHRREHGPVRVADTRPHGNPVARFNTRAAVLITRAVGSMYCAYLFCLLALYGLPPAMHGGSAAFVQWASSQFIQLVLLPIIIVGGAVLAETADRMNRRQFEDVEALLHGQSEQAAHLAAQDEKILAILDRLDTGTEGGLTAVLAEAKAARADVTGLRDILATALSGSAQQRKGAGR